MFFKVIQVGLADAAADRHGMEFDIVGFRLSQRTQQVSSQFRSCGAAESFSLPDFSDGMTTLIAVPNHLSDSGLQHFVGAQLVFEFGHTLGGKQFVEPGTDFSIGPHIPHREFVD